METDLVPIKAALGDMTDVELNALIDATYKAEQIAPGLLAWIDTAWVWQLQRRDGYDFELQPPEAAIPPEEDAVSVDAAIALRDTFAHDSSAVGALFDALVDLLTGSGQRH